MESAGFFTSGVWLEPHFRSTETFNANIDDVSVWELAGLLLVNYRSRELCVVIHAKLAQFLCDMPSNLPLCGGSGRVPSVGEVLDEILCKITSSHAKDGVMQSVTFVDGHCVRHVRRASRNVQESLGRHVHGGHVERLKPLLRHALLVSLGVRGQNGMLFRRNPEFVVERVMPDVLHDVPIRDRAVLGGQSRQAQHRSDAQYFLSRPGLAAPQPVVSAVDRRTSRPQGSAHEVDS